MAKRSTYEDVYRFYKLKLSKFVLPKGWQHVVYSPEVIVNGIDFSRANFITSPISIKDLINFLEILEEFNVEEVNVIKGSELTSIRNEYFKDFESIKNYLFDLSTAERHKDYPYEVDYNVSKIIYYKLYTSYRDLSGSRDYSYINLSSSRDSIEALDYFKNENVLEKLKEKEFEKEEGMYILTEIFKDYNLSDYLEIIRKNLHILKVNKYDYNVYLNNFGHFRIRDSKDLIDFITFLFLSILNNEKLSSKLTEEKEKGPIKDILLNELDNIKAYLSEIIGDVESLKFEILYDENTECQDTLMPKLHNLKEKTTQIILSVKDLEDLCE